MAPNGDITIFGDEITLEADEINFYGPVNKEITAPPAVPTSLELAPLAVSPIAKLPDPDPPPGNFRLRVLNHLCWDDYDEDAQLFHPGQMNNKPIPDKNFRIRLPDDGIVETCTDSAGDIELESKNELDGEFHVLFEPEEARLNDSYVLFDQLKHPLEKEPNAQQTAEQGDANRPIVTPEMELLYKPLKVNTKREIRKEAAWVRQANDGFGL
ncbi:MAG: hypothetical protein R2940_02515 [Syntrophotaleaceae bacterium]